MRIQHNVTAMNSHRMYTINSGNMAKNVEKLSSGYKINRAGDDAAGLAISEKMRGQIRGLTMASKNSQDAISLIQTAEGALQSAQNILQRMRELSVQSASDTNMDEVDREALDMEFQQLKQEIDQTADKTEFNNMKLIDGSFGKKLDVAGTLSNGAQNLKLSGAFKQGDSIQLSGFSSGTSSQPITSSPGTATFVLAKDVVGASPSAPTIQVVVGPGSWSATSIAGVSTDGVTAISLGTSYSTSFTVDGKTYNISFQVMTNSGANQDGALGNTTINQTSEAKVIQIGANQGDELEISIANMDSKSIGDYAGGQFDTETGALAGALSTENQLFSANVSTRENASDAIRIVNGALNMVSMQRAALGAKQNRLEFKIENLDNSTENLQAAESRIRDTDMAKEMTNFVKNNILFQASTAMLAQANSLPQGVLQLLG